MAPKKKADTAKTDTAKAAKPRPSAKAATPLEQAQAAVDKVAEGWKVDHAQPPQVTDTAGAGKTTTVVTVSPGEYRAHKRHPVGTGLIEITGDTIEQLAFRIGDWEAAQFPAEQPEPTKEQIANSQAATAELAVTAGARP